MADLAFFTRDPAEARRWENKPHARVPSGTFFQVSGVRPPLETDATSGRPPARGPSPAAARAASPSSGRTPMPVSSNVSRAWHGQASPRPTSAHLKRPAGGGFTVGPDGRDRASTGGFVRRSNPKASLRLLSVVSDVAAVIEVSQRAAQLAQVVREMEGAISPPLPPCEPIVLQAHHWQQQKMMTTVTLGQQPLSWAAGTPASPTARPRHMRARSTHLALRVDTQPHTSVFGPPAPPAAPTSAPSTHGQMNPNHPHAVHLSTQSSTPASPALAQHRPTAPGSKSSRLINFHSQPTTPYQFATPIPSPLNARHVVTNIPRGSAPVPIVPVVPVVPMPDPEQPAPVPPHVQRAVSLSTTSSVSSTPSSSFSTPSSSVAVSPMLDSFRPASIVHVVPMPEIDLAHTSSVTDVLQLAATGLNSPQPSIDNQFAMPTIVITRDDVSLEAEGVTVIDVQSPTSPPLLSDFNALLDSTPSHDADVNYSLTPPPVGDDEDFPMGTPMTAEQEAAAEVEQMEREQARAEAAAAAAAAELEAIETAKEQHEAEESLALLPDLTSDESADEAASETSDDIDEPVDEIEAELVDESVDEPAGEPASVAREDESTIEVEITPSSEGPLTPPTPPTAASIPKQAKEANPPTDAAPVSGRAPSHARRASRRSNNASISSLPTSSRRATLTKPLVSPATTKRAVKKKKTSVAKSPELAHQDASTTSVSPTSIVLTPPSATASDTPSSASAHELADSSSLLAPALESTDGAPVRAVSDGVTPAAVDGSSLIVPSGKSRRATALAPLPVLNMAKPKIEPALAVEPIVARPNVGKPSANPAKSVRKGKATVHGKPSEDDLVAMNVASLATPRRSAVPHTRTHSVLPTKAKHVDPVVITVATPSATVVDTSAVIDAPIPVGDATGDSVHAATSIPTPEAVADSADTNAPADNTIPAAVPGNAAPTTVPGSSVFAVTTDSPSVRPHRSKSPQKSKSKSPIRSRAAHGRLRKGGAVKIGAGANGNVNAAEHDPLVNEPLAITSAAGTTSHVVTEHATRDTLGDGASESSSPLGPLDFSEQEPGADSLAPPSHPVEPAATPRSRAGAKALAQLDVTTRGGESAPTPVSLMVTPRNTTITSKLRVSRATTLARSGEKAVEEAAAAAAVANPNTPLPRVSAGRRRTQLAEAEDALRRELIDSAPGVTSPRIGILDPRERELAPDFDLNGVMISPYRQKFEAHITSSDILAEEQAREREMQSALPLSNRKVSMFSIGLPRAFAGVRPLGSSILRDSSAYSAPIPLTSEELAAEAIQAASQVERKKHLGYGQAYTAGLGHHEGDEAAHASEDHHAALRARHSGSASPRSQEERELFEAEAHARAGGGAWSPRHNGASGPNGGSAPSIYGHSAPFGHASGSPALGGVSSSGYGVPPIGLSGSSTGSHTTPSSHHPRGGVGRPDLDVSLVKGVGFDRDARDRDTPTALIQPKGWNFGYKNKDDRWVQRVKNELIPEVDNPYRNKAPPQTLAQFFSLLDKADRLVAWRYKSYKHKTTSTIPPVSYDDDIDINGVENSKRARYRELLRRVAAAAEVGALAGEGADLLPEAIPTYEDFESAAYFAHLSRRRFLLTYTAEEAKEDADAAAWGFDPDLDGDHDGPVRYPFPSARMLYLPECDLPPDECEDVNCLHYEERLMHEEHEAKLAARAERKRLQELKQVEHARREQEYLQWMEMSEDQKEQVLLVKEKQRQDAARAKKEAEEAEAEAQRVAAEKAENHRIAMERAEKEQAVSYRRSLPPPVVAAVVAPVEPAKPQPLSLCELVILQPERFEKLESARRNPLSPSSGALDQPAAHLPLLSLVSEFHSAPVSLQGRKLMTNFSSTVSIMQKLQKLGRHAKAKLSMGTPAAAAAAAMVPTSPLLSPIRAAYADPSVHSPSPIRSPTRPLSPASGSGTVRKMFTRMVSLTPLAIAPAAAESTLSPLSLQFSPRRPESAQRAAAAARAGRLASL